ncbi:transposase [Paenibacillus cremeus]|uniref:Transposase n=1 Tax=Paenibacillus cremeus TaxID=2163881 RepID=A0A559JB18_9BACL|nr:transposase [Paenibacillus cremeus]TVX97051.1 transposase [Paenibacillus cremeus]
MRPKDRIVPEKTIYFRPEITNCPHCEAKLTRAHAAWKKKIATLQGVIFAWSMSYRCPNRQCLHFGALYRSAEAEKLCMKFTTYGFDVLCLVGELRFKHHMTRQEIADELNRLGVKTTDRNAQMLYERYLALLGASVDQHVREVLKSVSEQNGGLLLSMDGVQPEKGNETLYVIREVFSGTVLSAKNLKSSSSEELQNLIRPIVELGYPIIGIVSDGQQSIRLAFETLLPHVPYQYCQYHYLKDIAKPVVDLDRKLKTEIKKNLRGIREIERKIESQNSVETEVAKGYIAAVRSLLLEDGNPPLDLPGMRIYQNAKAIQASLEQCLSKKGALHTPGHRQNIQ